MEKHKPVVGDILAPDGGTWPEALREDDGFKDSSFPGCQFRVPRGGNSSWQGYLFAVNVTVTGKDHWVRGAARQPWYKCRVKIEWVGDGEPSTFSKGWLYHA